MFYPAGHIVSWNAGAERIKGWRQDEIVGKHFSVFYPADAIARGLSEQELKVAEEGRYVDADWCVRKDGFASLPSATF